MRSTEGTEAGWFGAEGAATNGLEKVTLVSFVSVTGASVEDTVESVTGVTVDVFAFLFCTNKLGNLRSGNWEPCSPFITARSLQNR